MGGCDDRQALDLRDDAIRRHDRRGYLSVLAVGLAPERAREITQAAWARRVEQHQRGALDDIELPGPAIRQARFLGERDRAPLSRRADERAAHRARPPQAALASAAAR